MPFGPEYSFQRYLSAKKSVDDRALNRQVQEVLTASVHLMGRPLRVLEIGAGIGTMLERMLGWNLGAQIEYTGIDAQPENMAAAWDRLPAWAAGQAYQVHGPKNGYLELSRGGQRILARFETIDLFEFASLPEHQEQWDLQVANAFLDLMDIPTTLPHLFSLIRPDGLFYYTINFDGVTTFEPVIDPILDARIESLYHQTMDERLSNGRPSGDSQAGRHLFSHLKAAGAILLAAGASDWVVYPRSGGYQEDEAYFLHFIVQTLQLALDGHPDLDRRQFEAWIAQRHAQIERGELVYLAHQLDFVGRPPAVPA